jgi:hypothetical protein
MHTSKVTERIKAKAFELLDQHPEGLRYSELHAKILASDADFKPNTINGSLVSGYKSNKSNWLAV